MLGIGCQRIDVLVNVAARSSEILLTPIGTKDGGRILGKTKDCLQLSFHHALFLRLHVVANLIGLRLHVVLLTITETINDKVSL